MLILGLTGGIATGKSTVSHYFSDKYHIPVIDADKIARDVVEPGTPGYNAIVKYFGPLVPDLTLNNDDNDPNTENGPLNRAALGAYVFSHKHELKILNSITHPAVRKRILYLLFKSYLQLEPVVVLDIPLLFESGMDWLCSRTLTISCNSDHQLERLLSRNKELTKDQALDRINSQMQLAEKVKLSDYVIFNDGGLDELKTNLDNFVKQNLPALQVNKANGWKHLVSSWWNLFQLIFPPFGALSAFVALLRKWIYKSSYAARV